jgi:hypothetical protein
MCEVWRGYDVAGIGGGEFALQLVSRQRVAPPYWRSDTHTHTHTTGTTFMVIVPAAAIISGVFSASTSPLPFVFHQSITQSQSCRQHCHHALDLSKKLGPQQWASSTLTPMSITTKLRSPPTSTAQGAKCMPSLARTLMDSSGPTFSVHGTSSLLAIFPGT